MAEETARRLAIVRDRIAEGYYERAEVRRTLAGLLLKRLARSLTRPGSAHPETA
jgi:hypothetical protein